MSSSERARDLRAWGEVCLAIAAIVAAIFFVRDPRARVAQPMAGPDRAPADAPRPSSLGAPEAPRPPTLPRYESIQDTVVVPGGNESDVVIEPPAPSTARDARTPVFTMLHGMCGTAEDICAYTRAITATRGFLVCPAGNARCGDASDWRGDGAEKSAHLDRALEAAETALDLERSGSRGDVLIGFSRGAFVARDVAYQTKGRWVGLVLLGAATIPDAERLRAAGIRRVVLGAGDYDGAMKTMRAAALRLTEKGLPARFVSLGPIYHALPRDLEQRLGASLDWVRGDGDDAGSGT
jgi:predicted esterase